jgi:hypothetical protein
LIALTTIFVLNILNGKLHSVCVAGLFWKYLVKRVKNLAVIALKANKKTKKL